MQTSNTHTTSNNYVLIPAKKTNRTPVGLLCAIIIAAATSFGSGWMIRGMDMQSRDTEELSKAVKTALDYAREAHIKDQTIDRLSQYCVPNPTDGTGQPPVASTTPP